MSQIRVIIPGGIKISLAFGRVLSLGGVGFQLFDPVSRPVARVLGRDGFPSAQPGEDQTQSSASQVSGQGCAHLGSPATAGYRLHKIGGVTRSEENCSAGCRLTRFRPVTGSEAGL